MRWKTWRRTLSADVIPFTSAGWSLQWWQSPLTTQKLRIWASFIFSLCNSYTYFHSITSYVTANIPASQLKRLIFYPHLMRQKTSDIYLFIYLFNSFQYDVWSPEISPWHVISTIQVNANGDRGVLACQWHEPYYDGIAPYRWTGSVPILRQWSKTGARAVKYGQCWVLAGVACTGETFTTPPSPSSVVFKVRAARELVGWGPHKMGMKIGKNVNKS